MTDRDEINYLLRTIELSRNSALSDAEIIEFAHNNISLVTNFNRITGQFFSKDSKLTVKKIDWIK